MTYQNLRKKSEGFTIIEVLIVLAIAGLIMLIVFLAIPQLRRNQQNNQMRNEASRVLSAATEYESNANGQQVNAAAMSNVYSAALDGTPTSNRKLTNVSFGGSGTLAEGTGRLIVGECSGTTATAVANARTYALQFTLMGNQTACIQS